MSADRSVADLIAEDFRGAAGSPFVVTAVAPPADGPSGQLSFAAEIAEVTEFSDRARGPFRAPFSVVFHGPLEPVMPQGMYCVEHDQIGALELFLVPLGPNLVTEPGQRPTAMRYEAVFG